MAGKDEGVLYQLLKAAGINVTAHHESDLYIPNTPAAWTIIRDYEKVFGCKLHASAFVDRNDGSRWIDIPFMYQPFWEGKR